MENLKDDQIRQAVRETYGRVAKSDRGGCGCGASACCGILASYRSSISSGIC